MKPATDLVRVRYRWLALTLISLFVVGSYFCYDSPALLESRLIAFFKVEEWQYSLLYTLYSFPNAFIPLFSGMLFDYPGKNTMLVCTLTLVCVGQWLVSLGAKSASFWLMIAGRAIFGIGSETLFALKATYTVLWFHD